MDVVFMVRNTDDRWIKVRAMRTYAHGGKPAEPADLPFGVTRSH
jgi:hypothetical protein